MVWAKLLEPDLLLADSVLALTPEMLKHHHIRGLILDVDETLIHPRSWAIATELKQWVAELQACELVLWLVSNNPNANRIRHIGESLDLPYVSGASKPFRRRIRPVVEAMKLAPQEVGMVGDRVFTDVLGGNRLGLFTILVDPFGKKAEDQYSLVRTAEFWLSRMLGASLVEGIRPCNTPL